MRASVKELRLLKRLREMADLLCPAFGLECNGVFINETLAEDHCYGICYIDEKTIELRLRDKHGDFYPIEVILETFAHELAHLDTHRHNARHETLTRAIYVAVWKLYFGVKKRLPL